MSDTKQDYYGAEMQARRDKFNQIINRIDMVLMNNIPEVDPSVWENWQGRNPSIEIDCEIEDRSLDTGKSEQWYCLTHDRESDDDYQCADFGSEGPDEIYQWFAINDSDATWLQNHNQYVTYSDMLDTYFLGIAHFGTGWDYVDSMVDDILGDGHE